MRYFIDFEYAETDAGVQPISIGIACEDGATYYAEFSGLLHAKLNAWLQQNVVPQLDKQVKASNIIRDEILSFVGNDEPEFWGYFIAYDWFLFCRIFGGMLQLPDGWPQLCFDIKQFGFSLGKSVVVSCPHHALQDAILTMEAYRDLLGTVSG